ncbi:MAG: SAM-dependent DNA methyltransferase, partial [bacterium]|nr:SAM-dependent DNA methyltransferase [bacterium]
ATTKEILAQKGDLTVHHYVTRKPSVASTDRDDTLAEVWERFNSEGRDFWAGMDALAETLDEVVAQETGDA